MNTMAVRWFPPLELATANASSAGDDGAVSLVRSAMAGNRAAFDSLHARYARMVHGILLARTSPSDADDLVQDVFFTAFQKMQSLRSPEAFPAWLATIARHRAMEHHRSVRQQAELRRQAAPARTASANGSTALEVLQAIQQLPEAYRETLILRLVEGFTGPEIAGQTGLTPESVRVNLCRGMKLLRERLGIGAST